MLMSKLSVNRSAISAGRHSGIHFSIDTYIYIGIECRMCVVMCILQTRPDRYIFLSIIQKMFITLLPALCAHCTRCTRTSFEFREHLLHGRYIFIFILSVWKIACFHQFHQQNLFLHFCLFLTFSGNAA